MPDNERPAWCPHHDCTRLIGGGLVDAGMCGGRLPQPEPHGGDMNTHRICLKQYDDPKPIDLKVNKSDLWYLSRMIGALHEKAKENP